MEWLSNDEIRTQKPMKMQKQWPRGNVVFLSFLLGLCLFCFPPPLDAKSSAPKKKKGAATTQSHTATRSRATVHRGKTLIRSKMTVRTQPRTKSRHFAKASSKVTHRRGRQRHLAALASRNAATAAAREATRRMLIERNYDDTVPPTPYAPEMAPFPVLLNDEPVVFRTNSAFVLPGETVTLTVGRTKKKNAYTIQSPFKTSLLGPNRWSWQAPHEAGFYPVKILHSAWGATVQLNVFVLAPLSRIEDGSLNGYQIGNYPTAPLRALEAYSLPRGFVEVTEANENTLLTPHFRLRQFLCKQESDYPKYVALDARLLMVLEIILKKVNEQGHQCPTLSVMSGYRTPHYNRAIGNSTSYSRHLWGDAADIFVDANPRDGVMDDLNDDGVIDLHDTEVLYGIVFDMYEPRVQQFLTDGFVNAPILQQLGAIGFADDRRLQRRMTGGLARYRESGGHGPFVHVDVRGIFTRWGR